MLNFSYSRNGALHFVKLGRLCFSFCIARKYRPLRPAIVPWVHDPIPAELMPIDVVCAPASILQPWKMDVE